MTYLEKLAIEHFRGVLARQEITFAKPDKRNGSGLTILVGPNNVGKSTIVEALRLVVSPPQLIDRKERHIDQALRISITDTARGYREITNPGLGANITVSGNAYPSADKLRYVPSRRAWSPRTGSHSIILHDYWRSKARNAHQEDSELVGRLNSFPPEERVAYQQTLQQIAPQLREWKIEYSDGNTYLEYVTINGSTHTADLFGDGISSLFRIALALYDPEESCVIIDEPELSLHPQAQKRLAKYISAKAADRQIILCTHSPYFLNWSDLAAGAAVYRLRQDRNGIEANRLSETAIANLHKLSNDWQKPQLLDAVAKEIFFADEAVFLEGQEDVSLISRFIENEGLTPLHLFGYGAGGSTNIATFLTMATELKIPCCSIFDQTSKDDYEKASSAFPKARNELLITDDIRDKKPPFGIGKPIVEGMFTTAGEIKPEYKDYLVSLIQEFREFLDSEMAP